MTTSAQTPVGVTLDTDWKPIPVDGVSHYHVSTSGEIMNTRTGCVLKLTKNPEGYLFTTLCCSDGTRRGMLAHRAVALAHIEKPVDLCSDPDATVHHIDAERDHNHVENLQWMSRQENAMERYRRSPARKIDRATAMALRASGYSIPQIAKTMGFSDMGIWSALRAAGGKTSRLSQNDISTLH
jgi:hypothetical protein